MRCLKPTIAWICGTTYCKADGLLSPRIVFSPNDAIAYYSKIYPDCDLSVLLERNQIELPCGKCAACQIRKRKDMSVRLCHERMMCAQAVFVTLTYNDDSVPVTDDKPFFVDSNRHKDDSKRFSRGISNGLHPTLLSSDLQKFIKRLRWHLGYRGTKSAKGRFDYCPNIRYFAVGEYGTHTHRPHYHLIIYGVNRLSGVGLTAILRFLLFRPPLPNTCARYVTKKFARLEQKISCHLALVPEFTLQSVRHGGIGATWFHRFGVDACKVGLTSIVVNGRVSKCSLPQYYLRLLRKHYPQVYIDLRNSRIDFVKRNVGNLVTFDDLKRSVEVAMLTDRYQSYGEIF
ncbi:unnamed protein product [Cylicocyclus nassatus]|uniref:Replication-associated protein ORF2/G2P domain-containing protein n=1 Tax=Cylicocyclus nassatus TaxID=53992 RepID=A0AA36M3N0_CYLNA|nr:unnamed protein product [Cylicocyclus nassatus]